MYLPPQEQLFIANGRPTHQLLRKLQLLLGHAQEATVYTYLDVLDEAQEIVVAALDEWDAQAAALEHLALDSTPQDGDTGEATK